MATAYLTIFSLHLLEALLASDFGLVAHHSRLFLLLQRARLKNSVFRNSKKIFATKPSIPHSEEVHNQCFNDSKLHNTELSKRH